jgi:DNA polymerase I-like protein with 3'-5' exonuclease and polymerase domains
MIFVPIIYLDIETDNSEGYNGLDVFGGRIVTVQLLPPNGNVIIIKDPTQEKMSEIKDILENNLIIGHNLKFDLKFLKQQFGITINNVYDTQIAEIVISGGLYAGKKNVVRLQDLVYRYCGKKMDKNEHKGFLFGVPLTMAQKEYAANDLRYLPIIFQKQQAKIKQLELETVINIEMQAIPAMVWLELSGIKVDLNKLDMFRINAERTRDELQAKLYIALGDINLNSPVQLVKALNGIGIPLKSTKKEEMIKYNYPVLDDLEEYKKVSKLLSAFINPLPEFVNSHTRRVHADYYQIGAVTGRFSCRYPNIQQQPSKSQKNWREIFIAEEGNVIVTADYSQIELRIVGQAARDKKYIEAYNTPGVDLHRRTAASLFNVPEDQVTKAQRSVAKSVNFGLNYGMWSSGLVKKLKADANIEATREEAVVYAENFQKMYPEITAYLDKSKKEGLRNNCVRTMAGRLIRFECIESSLEASISKTKEAYKKKHNGESMSILDEQRLRVELKRGIKGSIGRQSKNYPIQGFCADLVKIAMARIYKILEPMGVKFIATVHDELVFECKKEQAAFIIETIRREMIAAGAPWFIDIPCDAEVFSDEYWHKD